MGRSDKHAAHHEHDDVVVHLPEGPPRLTPAAAQALLRLLRNAWRHHDTHQDTRDDGGNSIEEWKEAA